jgi:hypothetical protein
MLGNLGAEEDTTVKRFRSINNKLIKNVKAQKKTKNTLKQYSNVNEKLANGFTISLNVIVDIGNVLKSYNYFLDEIEELVSQMDTTHISSSSVKDLKSLTDVALNKLNMNYTDQLNEIIDAYKNNNMDPSNFTSFIKGIPPPIEKKSGGSGRVKHKHI